MPAGNTETQCDVAVQVVLDAAASAAQAGDISVAEEAFAKALAIDRAVALIPYANFIADRKRDSRTARHLLREAIAAGDSHGYVNLAWLESERGKARRAERLFRRAIRLGDHLARRQFGVFLVEQGRPTEAAVHLAEAVRLGDEKAYVDLGNAYLDVGEVDAALAYYRRAQQCAVPEGYAVEGYYHHHTRDDPARALTCFERALELGDSAVCLDYGLLLVQEGREDEALDVYRQGVAHGHGACATNAAALLRRRGEGDAADEMLKKGMALGDRLAYLVWAEELASRTELADARSVLRSPALRGFKRKRVRRLRRWLDQVEH